MFTEDDLLPLSGLQHLVFCEGQCALIHLEQIWAENQFTAEGRVLHQRTHSEESESRSAVRIAHALRIHSLRLGLSGVTDIVELHQASDGEELCAHAVRLPGLDGSWRPYPVEYKRGRPKPGLCDKVQLCAQALCLEEMLDVEIDLGAIFYGRPRRRLEVIFDTALRQETEVAAIRLHELFDKAVTPPAVYSKKCHNCSLLALCQPKKTNSPTAAGRYVTASVLEIDKSRST